MSEEKLMTRQGAEVADLLVERLAKVILRAGDCKAWSPFLLTSIDF